MNEMTAKNDHNPSDRRSDRTAAVKMHSRHVVILASLVVAVGLACSTDPSARTAPEAGDANGQEDSTREPLARLKALTLNVAHGRKDGPNQALQSEERIRKNLAEVAALISKANPDFVALQEADGPSMWSGRFDHVAYLAERTQLPNFRHGHHVDNALLQYGTAVLSREPLIRTETVTFDPSPPTPPKGFLVAEMSLRTSRGDVNVRWVSVHLDFLRRGVRSRQISQLIDHLKSESGPLIVMGDFNCEWSEDESTLQTLSDELDLTTYNPTSSELTTFPSTGSRIDWIFISRELRFESYEVLPTPVSDHLAVAATITLEE